MGQEMQVIVLARLLQALLGDRVDLAAQHARLDRLHGDALDFLDLAKQILKFGVGLAQDGHAGEVPDIAVIVAAGIEGEHIALLPSLLRRRAVEV